MVPVDSICSINSKVVFKRNFGVHTPVVCHVYVKSICVCVCVHVCVGDAAGRSGGPTGDSAVGRLSVCSPSFLRDGKQPAFIRCVLGLCLCFPLITFLETNSFFLKKKKNIFEQV